MILHHNTIAARSLKTSFSVALLVCLLCFWQTKLYADPELVAYKSYYAKGEKALMRISFPPKCLADSIKLEQIQQLMHYAPDGHDYNLQVDSINGNLQQITTAPLPEGTHMVIAHTRKLHADPANENVKNWLYLADSTIDVSALPAGSMQFCLKAIFQAGTVATKNCLLQTSLPLDIIPVKNIFASTGKAAKAEFILQYKGRPVANAKMIFTRKDGSSTPRQFIVVTNKQGEAKIELERMGSWVVTACQLGSNNIGSTAAPQLYVASLSWSYAP